MVLWKCCTAHGSFIVKRNYLNTYKYIYKYVYVKNIIYVPFLYLYIVLTHSGQVCAEGESWLQI